MKTETIEHTKGEWDAIHIKTEDGFKKGTHEHYFQVVTKKQNHDNKIGQANANLISAAPDMLEALIEAEKELKACYRRIDPEKHSSSILMLVQMAIKKAEW